MIEPQIYMKPLGVFSVWTPAEMHRGQLERATKLKPESSLKRLKCLHIWSSLKSVHIAVIIHPYLNE